MVSSAARPIPPPGRSRLVFLTAKGESARPVAKSAGDRVEERWAELIGSGPLEDLRGRLRQLLRLLHADDAPPAAD